ncbi:ATP-binding protein [Microbacterium sp. RURRCA19A]|uniref:ATP-binding protein n=1 Tax=Microbacterium sp. RURRCA19A TaxID=1907391 RepID=UPI0009551D3A|nr:ATP-binding protein [Microbacterium sp. RURRCA19A]SIR95483.1 Predicted transcriptional regulator, contains HTH domain [Microbacterium sp. RURRCA19A]
MPGLTADQSLLAKLCAAPAEAPWLEFKENKAEPQEVGEYISALANSAVLAHRTHAYMVWGVRDADHAVVGTTFDPWSSKGAGSEDLVPWLSRGLDPQVYFQFRRIDTGGNIAAVLLEIDAARSRPVAFRSERYVRIGSYKKNLRDYPEHEARLWEAFRETTFETGSAKSGLSDEEAIELLAHSAYFDLLRLPLPETRRRVADQLGAEGFLVRSEAGTSVTNLGALLFARDLGVFSSVSRKATRLTQYRTASRAAAVRSQDGQRGYAAGFEGLIDYMSALLPREEITVGGLRQEIPRYPDLVIRELVVNMLIHQDLTVTGSGPMIEVFPNRIEFTNPGEPLISVRRFLGGRPPSRNEALASFMTRARISEERGSGWEKIATEVELHQLPAPKITVEAGHTKVTVFGPRSFAEMTRDERVDAIYLHAQLRHASGEPTTNSSARERFRIPDANSAQISRVLRDALAAGLLVIEDPTVGAKSRRYLPFWAQEDTGG